MYRYYSTQRPVGLGTYPKKDKVTEIVNFDDRRHIEHIGRAAWGYLEYLEPLTEQEADNYELVYSREESE